MRPFLTWRQAPYLLAGIALVLFAWQLRQLPYSIAPLRHSFLHGAGSLLAFACAASALVRYRGTGDYTALTLSVAFGLTGVIEAGSGLALFGTALTGGDTPPLVPVDWIIRRTLLAALFAVALLLGKWSTLPQPPATNITRGLLLALSLGFLTVVASVVAPGIRIIHLGGPIPRPLDLVPAAIFLVAALGYHRRALLADSAFERGIWFAVLLNVRCHLVASQSERPSDAAFFLVELLQVASYTSVVGGKLMDNARLYEQVQRLALTDALTGLANYRRLIEALHTEMQRFDRTGQPFTLLLLDVDGLKTINDVHGHLAGSRVLCRLGQVLRQQSRALDTPARYGGDEFAVVLPDTSAPAARQVAQRICLQLTNDGEQPQFSVAIGVAVYPHDGKTIEKVLGAADRDLYQVKQRSDNRRGSRMGSKSSNLHRRAVNRT